MPIDRASYGSVISLHPRHEEFLASVRNLELGSHCATTMNLCETYLLLGFIDIGENFVLAVFRILSLSSMDYYTLSWPL